MDYGYDQPPPPYSLKEDTPHKPNTSDSYPQQYCTVPCPISCPSSADIGDPPPYSFGQQAYPGYEGVQQEQTVMTDSPATVFTSYQPPDVSYVGHIVTSCVVFWLCNPLFGLIAFVLAMLAQRKADTDSDAARHLGRVSIRLSVVGVVTTIILVLVLVIVLTKCLYYSVNSQCFKYRTSLYSNGYDCYVIHNTDSYYDGVYCYYN